MCLVKRERGRDNEEGREIIREREREIVSERERETKTRET
jgi:hypothetical protein